MRITLVHNPAAGSTSSDEDAAIADLLRASGHAVSYVSTGSAAWRAALQDPGDLVAIAGGDGTVAEVLRSLDGIDVAATILPVGTANNIAATLGIAGSPAEVVAAWPGYHARRFDLGIASLPDGREQRFVEAVGVGALTDMIAALVGPAEGLNQAIRRHEGLPGYVRLLREMIKRRAPEPLRIRVDGREQSDNVLIAEVLNIGRVGPSLRLGAGADPGDGLLDLLLVNEDGRQRLDDFLAAQEEGDPDPPALPTLRARKVGIEGSLTSLRFDDQVVHAGRGSVTIRVDPGALRLLAP